MSLTSVMYELASECPKCKQPLPLNGATESVHCGACQSVVETPVALWRTILGEATGEAAGMSEGTGQNSTMMLGGFGLTVKATYGRLTARCECKTEYPVDELATELESGDGRIFCGGCGKQASVRRAPAWFAEVHPAVVGLVRETHASDTAGEKPESVRFHCYHCGASMPLEGKERSVTCQYCNNDLMVPDEIWVRLHPMATVQRWFGLLDMGGAVGPVPEDVSDFCDLTVDPNGHMVIAYHADDDGDVGHPCRIGAADRNGMLRWIQDGVTFSDDAELMVSRHDARIVLIDEEEGFVRFLDSADGSPIRTVPSPGEDGKGTGLNVRDHRGVTIAWDGSFVVRRYWDDGQSGALRRFAVDGTRIPLWPGQKVEVREPSDAPEWKKLRDEPIRLPDSAKFGYGWDGAFYAVDEKLRHIARWSGDGKLQGVVDTGIDWCKEVKAFDVSRDGTMHVLLQHAEQIGDDHWTHVARFANGQVEHWLGPHVEGSPLIGQHDDKLEVLPDGTTFLGGYGMSSLRIFGPDRTLLWKSNATRRHEQYLQEELEKARRGKKLVADRE